MKRIGYIILAATLLLTSSAGTVIVKNPCPANMVKATKNVCIDKFEWPNIPGEKPMLGISGIAELRDEEKGIVMNAEKLCQSVGKRVCSAKEWIAACEGSQHNKYPFREDLPKYTPGDNTGLCNYDKKYRAVHEYKVFIRDEQEMNYLDQSEPAGSRKDCVSQNGAWDMMGNAEEWVRCKNGNEGWCLASRFWAEPRSCKALVTSHSPRWHYYNSSHRCCFTIKKVRLGTDIKESK